jgi:acyl carrier protein
MTDGEAFAMITEALEKTGTGLSAKVTRETHLTDDKIIDSLDSMNFLFELETIVGKKLTAIDETFDDFRVERLIEILRAA